MCGRAAFTAELDEVIERLGVERHPSDLKHRYNIAPGYGGVGAPLIVRVARDGARELLSARWWLIPRWWSKPLKQLPTAFNARAEGISRTAFFRDAFVHRRCVMPATAWYEFRGARGRKESFAFQLPARQLFGFAGIWESWVDPANGEMVNSFAIVTTAANEAAAKYHDRMPVVLGPPDYAAWLDPANHDVEQLQSLLRPWPRELEIFRTQGFGNDPRQDGPECLAPMAVGDGALLPSEQVDD